MLAVKEIDLGEALWEAIEGLSPLVDYFEGEARASFFQALEKQVGAGRLPNISPFLLSPLIAYLADIGNVKVIPSIIQKVQIEAIDINQSLQIFWSYDCWEGVIIVYNHVLSDYRTPLEKLIAKIDSSTTVADTLLMYLSCSLGRKKFGLYIN